MRRVSLTNHSTRTREIELTSYAEVVLNTPAADAAHQAFSNLFIETEFIAGENAIMAHRRRRRARNIRSGPFTLSWSKATRSAGFNTKPIAVASSDAAAPPESDRRDGGSN